MPLLKRVKDQLIKRLLGEASVPRGLFEIQHYFRTHDPINFKFEKTDEGLVAVSTNFQYGSIVTSGKNYDELDRNIKDAILTSFEVPSSYAGEAKINKVGAKQEGYVLA